MKIERLLIILVPVLLFSCGTTAPINYRYSAPLSGTPQMYQPKPMSSDPVKTANYISAGISSEDGTDNNFNDVLTSGFLTYQRSHTFKNICFSYGGYGFMGVYQNNSTTTGPADTHKQVGDAYFNSKSFYGFGVQTSASMITSVDRVDFRPIGIVLNYSNESGDYLDYRNNAASQPYIYTDASSNLFSTGLTSEIIFHNKNSLSTQFGFRIYLGTFLGDHDLTNNSGRVVPNYTKPLLNTSFSFFFQLEKYFLVFDAGRSAMFRLGYRF